MQEYIVKEFIKKVSKMSPQDMYNYAKQFYSLYQFLNGVKSKDDVLNQIFSKYGINQTNFYKLFTEENMNKIYNSLSDDQKKQMTKILVGDQNINSDETPVEENETDEEIPAQGGRSKRRKRSSKRKRIYRK